MIAIRPGGLDHPDVVALLEAHAAAMEANSAPGTCHYLDLSKLMAPEISFWSVWDGDALAGCGAMKALGDGHGEIKSMRVTDAYLGRGVGKAILDHIVGEARGRGYTRVSLETGVTPYYMPAQLLYERAGFVDCTPFADYAPSDANRFMTLPL